MMAVLITAVNGVRSNQSKRTNNA